MNWGWLLERAFSLAENWDAWAVYLYQVAYGRW